MREIKQIILHCSDSEFGNSKAINNWHLKRGWDEIGYHYVITNGISEWNSEYDKKTDGIIETGRDIAKIGSHCKGENSDSIGVCLIGIAEFTPKQFESLQALIERLRERFGKLAIYGHCEKTSGRKQGKSCPNIDMDWLRKEWSLN